MAGIISSLAIGFVLWYSFSRSSNKKLSQPNSPFTGPKIDPHSTLPRTDTSASKLAEGPSSIRSAIQARQASRSALASKQALMRLEAALAGLPKETASEAIREFLATGIDASTQVAFEVGDAGRLNGANTLRIFLLDYLGQIDPPKASEIGRDILSKPESADEWAVCLRNFARANSSPESRAFLLGRLGLLLTHLPWRESPTTGYLEAFDVVVHVGGTELFPELMRLLRLTNSPAVAHASFLAADRLVMNQPIPTLEALLRDASLMQSRETTRAGYFARADVSNPEQRCIVESYLLNPGLKTEELETFADSFPNENQRLSRNLLTRTSPRSGAVIARRDRETLRVVEEWIRQDRFKVIAPHLRTVQKRLQAFLNANQPGSHRP